jgi:hypothetical protein
MLSRRDVAKMGLAGMLLASAGGVALFLRPTVLREPRRALWALTPRDYSILAAIADRVGPANGAFPAASDIEVPERIDDLLATLPGGVARELSDALIVIEETVPGLSTFTGSSPEQQDAILDGWRTSRLETRRMIYKGVVGLISATYYASPEVWKAVGYPGPPDFGNAP